MATTRAVANPPPSPAQTRTLSATEIQMDRESLKALITRKTCTMKPDIEVVMSCCGRQIRPRAKMEASAETPISWRLSAIREAQTHVDDDWPVLTL